MSEKTLKIVINCGETTCANELGKFCEFFGSRRMGTIALCLLFLHPNPGREESASVTPLEEKDGWRQRCHACLDAEVPDE